MEKFHSRYYTLRHWDPDRREQAHAHAGHFTEGSTREGILLTAMNKLLVWDLCRITRSLFLNIRRKNSSRTPYPSPKKRHV
mmetsp:Transcript_22263/g.31111  ORF Transcript_22263/g.31111 Transcript_22263/m.31111 type:complete len:81 (-) Transcript_22263:402-644(-)